MRRRAIDSAPFLSGRTNPAALEAITRHNAHSNFLTKPPELIRSAQLDCAADLEGRAFELMSSENNAPRTYGMAAAWPGGQSDICRMTFIGAAAPANVVASP